jgi:methylenetetrahydrofolate reductase (NADPH)
MIYFELVPKDLEELVKEATQICTQFKAIQGINIPDIASLPIRSGEATAKLLENKIEAIPHIVCKDKSVEMVLAEIAKLMNLGLQSVLILSGDQTTQRISSNYISKVKGAYPQLKVYAALDPYRQSIKAELDYCEEKIEAGADGFFTQPFFYEELAEIYLEQLSGKTKVFLGICPVITESALYYWKTKNNSIFPQGFKISMDYNAVLAQKLLALAVEHKQHSYLMPIMVDSIKYLKEINPRL